MPLGPGDLIVLQPAAITSTTTRDFSAYSAYIGSLGLVRHEGETASWTTQTLQLQPARTDVGSNPQEIRPESGNIFSQADFSHGQGQTFFHRPRTSDPAKYLYDEGFDISTPGSLKHHNATALAAGGALTAGSSGRSAQAGSAVFVADGTNIRRYDTITGAVTTENPHAGEVGVTVRDITAEGDRLFAALGTGGIHVRDGGVWSHYSDVPARRVAFVRDRLMAASATAMYEITAGGVTPTAKVTLKAGWSFEDIGENGQFIYAPAANVAAGLSRVHHFGLDSSLVLQHQGSTSFPDNDLIYSFKGLAAGTVILGGGRKNRDAGQDAVLYQAEPSDNGSLTYSLIADSKGALTRDLSVKALATIGRRVLLGWTLGTASPYGQREGLAVYDPALGSFSHHLSSSTTTTTPDPVLSVQVFGGRVVFVTIDGVYYETTTKVAEAFLITSLATWGNAGLKVWDTHEVSGKKLPATSEVQMQYTTRRPEEGEWSIAGTWDTTDSTEDIFRTQNLEGQKLAVKLVSRANSSRTVAPEIETYSVRSHPTVRQEEYRLVRTFRIFGRDAIADQGEVFYQNPRSVRNQLRDKRNTWVDYYEADCAYSVRITEVQDLLVAQPDYMTTQGEYEKEAFFVTVVMEGTVA